MLTAKGKNISFTLKSAWFEVTLKEFTDLYPKRKTDEEGNVTLDPYDTAKALVSDLDAYLQCEAGEIDRMISLWLPQLGGMPDWPELTVPYLVAGVRPPDEIGTCTQLQVESAKQLIEDQLEEDSQADYISLSIPMLAIFLYPLLTKEPLTDTDQIERVIPVIEALPVTEALPLAAFFLTSLTSLKPSGRMSFVVSYPKPRRWLWLMRWFPSLTLFRTTPSYRKSLKSET